MNTVLTLLLAFASGSVLGLIAGAVLIQWFRD